MARRRRSDTRVVRVPGLSPSRLAATLLGVAGFLVAAAAVLLPWVTIPAGAAGPGVPPAPVTWSGLDDPDDLGLLALAGAAVGLGLLLPSVLPRGRWLALPAGAVAVGLGSVARLATEARDLPRDLAATPAAVEVTAEGGLVVLLTGAGMALVGCLLVLVTPRRARVRIALAELAPGTPPGWFPDPAGSGALRWWDGGGWSTKVLGSSDLDPLADGPSDRRGSGGSPA